MKKLLRLVFVSLIASAALCVTASASPKGKPKLGLQAWTFRNLTLAETLDKAKALGIHYLQAYPGQTIGGGIEGKMGPDLDEAARTKVLEMAVAKGVRIVSFGVTGAGDEKGWRQLFDFAKAMSFMNIAIEPKPDQLKIVSRMAKESGVAATLHNHPEPSTYYDPNFAVAKARWFTEEVGLCADTGHWARSGFDPVESLRLVEGKLISLHFKDLNEFGKKEAHDVIWGTGVSKAKEQIAELQRQGFEGYVFIEYEHETPELSANVAACVRFFEGALR